MTTTRERLPIHVYLAAKFGRKDEMLSVARWLRSLGYVVTSRWLEVEQDMLHSPEAPAWAVGDVVDVLAADVLVAFTERDGVPGGGKGRQARRTGRCPGRGKGSHCGRTGRKHLPPPPARDRSHVQDRHGAGATRIRGIGGNSTEGMRMNATNVILCVLVVAWILAPPWRGSR